MIAVIDNGMEFDENVISFVDCGDTDRFDVVESVEKTARDNSDGFGSYSPRVVLFAELIELRDAADLPTLVEWTERQPE